ncbi:uncharacterized protein PgNI_12353 [Pyricularia grisea]|uniref:F-box domain-containing protein n=1 Tax=Pyricularia grisea TaxID=148305 RepID=A0A6P8AMQ9_PYRGI|nr:uncharacterized protein PgNI_12353 [Pyricularia grisea]TLD03335.1 hypothetical protein PgNI_12353 [Pyricularia grisea]
MDNLAVAHLVLRLTRPPPNNPFGPPKIRHDDYFIRLTEAETGTDAAYKIIKHLCKWDFPSKEKHLEKSFVDRKYEDDKERSQDEDENDQEYEVRMQWTRDRPYRQADCQARWLKCAVIMGRALDFLEQAHREYGDLSGKSGIHSYHYSPRYLYEYVWACLHQGSFTLARKERFVSQEEHNSGAWLERLAETIQRVIEKWHNGFNLDENMLSSIPTDLKYGLVSLPNELKFSIADLLSQHDLAAFAQTSSHFSDLAIRTLYQKDAKSDNPRALIWAVATGQKTIAEKALKAGTDVSLRFAIRTRDTRFDQSIVGLLHLAIVCSQGDALITIPNQDKTFVPFVDGNIEGRMAVIRLLFGAEAEVNLTDNMGRTPLSYAAYYRLEPMVKMLLGEHAKINWRDNKWHTPLAFAIESRSEAVVRLLLEARAQVNVKDHIGETPLSLAAQYGSETIVRLLLEAKAKVNVKDRRGRTPLWYAVASGSKAVVRLLLEARAKVNLADSGRTPLSLVSKQEHKEISELLLAAKEVEDRKSKVLRLRSILPISLLPLVRAMNRKLAEIYGLSDEVSKALRSQAQQHANFTQLFWTARALEWA